MDMDKGRVESATEKFLGPLGFLGVNHLDFSLVSKCLLLQTLVIFRVTAICSAEDDDERWIVAMFVGQRGERSDGWLILV